MEKCAKNENLNPKITLKNWQKNVEIINNSVDKYTMLQYNITDKIQQVIFKIHNLALKMVKNG